MKKMITWVEIPTNNFERAVDFYNNLFDLKLEILDFGNEKMACFPTGDGAIIYEPNYKPSKDGVLVNLVVIDNIESSSERIINKGGKILKPKTKITANEKGYFAIFLDSEGNKLGLYEN